jgi:hypothetical protein
MSNIHKYRKNEIQLNIENLTPDNTLLLALRKLDSEDRNIRITGLAIFNPITNRVATVKRNTDQYTALVNDLGLSTFKRMTTKVIASFTLLVLLAVPHFCLGSDYNFVGHKMWYLKNALQAIKTILGDY